MGLITNQMSKKNQVGNRRYERWSDYLANIRERANYSVKRMDLLIISICGAGIYIIFETIREFKTGPMPMENSILLKWSGIFFLVAVLANFTSQITGFFCNEYASDHAISILEDIDGMPADPCEQKLLAGKVKNFGKFTRWLNILSAILMITGLFLLTWFNYLLF